MEMLKPKDSVRLKVQYRPEEFSKIKGLPGDSFYIRYQWPGLPGTWGLGRGFWWRLFPVNIPVFLALEGWDYEHYYFCKRTMRCL